MLDRQTFDTRDDLAKALADAVSADIAAAIEQDGAAVIAVSGGSTPSRFFMTLGKRKDVDWSKVTVTLVDERWVDETSDRSNAMLVNEKMLQGPAAVARFLPLYSGGDEPDAAAIARTNASLAGLPKQFASVILGMGSDGHTASFFPGGDTLDDALSNPGPALAIRAPGAGEPRVTLTLPRLLQTRSLYIHIEGAEKSLILDIALAPNGEIDEMPVRAVLNQTEKPVTIYWAP